MLVIRHLFDVQVVDYLTALEKAETDVRIARDVADSVPLVDHQRLVRVREPAQVLHPHPQEHPGRVVVVQEDAVENDHRQRERCHVVARH